MEKERIINDYSGQDIRGGKKVYIIRLVHSGVQYKNNVRTDY